MQNVDVKVHDAIATVLMDRPEKCNALNPRLIDELSTAFSDLHREKKVRAIVLSGRGDHFCAGMDLNVFAKITQMPAAEAQPEWFTVWQNLSRLFEEMLRLPKPIIAAVDGAAFGAGLGLALAADMVVASSHARFAAPAIRRGLVSGATTALIEFRVGAAAAARIVLSGEPFEAGEAYRLGLCDALVDRTQVWVAASELAARCGQGSTESMQATKRFLNERIGESLLSQLLAGAADSATACTTESAAEGIKAFVEKRAPDWT